MSDKPGMFQYGFAPGSCSDVCSTLKVVGTGFAIPLMGVWCEKKNSFLADPYKNFVVIKSMEHLWLYVEIDDIFFFSNPKNCPSGTHRHLKKNTFPKRTAAFLINNPPFPEYAKHPYHNLFPISAKFFLPQDQLISPEWLSFLTSGLKFLSCCQPRI